MNEKIKELFEQAHIQPPTTRSGQFAFTPPKTFSLEKFAELIVRECMKLNRDILCEDDPDYLDKVYKEHFGVEE
jgi:hypothetical protein